MQAEPRLPAEPPRISGARLEIANPHGLPMFPLAANSKKPRKGDKWQERPKSPDPADIPPGHNAAVATGGRFFVLDFDRKSGGVDSYIRLVVLEDRLPASYTVRTQGGGYHVYLRCPEPPPSGVNVLDHLGLPGVDLRGEGGYAVAPGSTYEGRRYEIDSGGPIADAPEWLIDALRSRKPREKADQAPLVELDTEEAIALAAEWLQNGAEEAVEGAGGDDATYRVAVRLRDFGVSESTALDLMLDHWNETKAHGPWKPDDLARKVTNAYSYGKRTPGIAVAELAHHEFEPLPPETIAEIERSRSERAAPVAAKGAATGVPLTLLRDLREREVDWLVDNLLPVGGFGVLYGKPGSYKSFVALFIAGMVAEGRQVFGRKVPQAGPVVYVAAEGAHGLKKRTDALVKVHGLNPGASIAFADKMLNLRSSLADCDALIASIEGLGWRPSLIVIDTLARTFAGGNENAPDDMGAFVNVMTHLQRRTGATVLVVHHSGKDSAKGSRGHSNLLGAVDSEFEAEKVRDAPAHGDGAGLGRLKVTKQKDGPAGFCIDYAVEKVIFSRGAGAWADAGVSEKSSLAVRELKEGEAAGPQERTLKQEQRDLLDIIRSIASDGKAVARKRIVEAARSAGWFRDAPGDSLSSTERSRLRRSLEALCSGYLEETPAGEFALSSLTLSDALPKEDAA